MSVIRITKEREAPYVMLDKTALKDTRLSFRAKGLHAFLMSKPDDWHINSEYLASLSPKEGREAIMMAMRELRDNGYTRRVTQRDAKGHVLGSDIIVYETPWLAEQDAADHELRRSVNELVEPGLEPDSPRNGLADNRVNRKSGKPKVGLTESRLNRKSANPQLLNKDNTQITETTLNTETTTSSPAVAGEVTSSDSPAGKFVAWWNEHIVPLGGRPFLLDDADATFITKANKALKSKSSRGFWDRVKQGFEASPWLQGKIPPQEGKRRFRATLPWLLSKHHQKGIANYTLVASGEWLHEAESEQPHQAISHDEVEL